MAGGIPIVSGLFSCHPSVMRLPLLLCACLVLPHSLAAAGRDWMKRLDDRLSLDRLSIPGTHNSCALHEPLPGTAKCQSLTLAEQLDLGVRFFDIRCRHVENRFKIHHGPIDQKLGFDEVIANCTRFLVSEPGETILLSIMETHKPQGNTRSFEATVDDYIARDPGRWYLDESIPKLGDVRGKIVLFRRYPCDPPKGLNGHRFEGNGSFSLHRLRVQDRYRVANAEEKWEAIAAHLAETREAKPGTLHLIFTSGYVPGAFGLPNITAVSKVIHPRLSVHLQAHPKSHIGIVILDFATPDLVTKILEANP